MSLRFTKMHGAGNDYIYIYCPDGEPEDPGDLAAKLSRRHFGIGADGLVLILPSGVADFRMRMFNADGSEGRMCGNASRCVGKYVYEKGLTRRTDVTLETLSGVKTLHLSVNSGRVTEVSVDMGEPSLLCRDVPVLYPGERLVGETVAVAGKEVTVTCVSMGNPHCVVFTEGVDGLDLEREGPLFENDPIFPDRVNTEFVEIKDPDRLKMRVWERGSGETLACGTGASAAVVAAVENGFCRAGESVAVDLPGGELKVRYSPGEPVLLSGGASFVYDGELYPEAE